MANLNIYFYSFKILNLSYVIIFTENVERITMLRKNKNNLLGILMIISMFVLIFILNYMTHYTSDDYAYRFVFKSHLPGTSPEKINGIFSIIKSQISHYKLWNGRFVAHFIVQFFMQYNKIIFDVFNTLIFILLGFIIYSILKKVSNINNKIETFIFIFTLLWLFTPEFGKSVLWLSGAGNYLWTSIIYSSFLLFNLKTQKSNLLTYVLVIVLGFISGATNENSGPAIILVIILLVLWKYLSSKTLDVWRIFGILSSCVGYLIMFTSPGSQKRGQQQISLDLLKDRLVHVYSASVSHFFFEYLILILFIFILVYQKKYSKSNFIFTTIMLIGHFSSIYCLVLSTGQPLRTFFGSNILLIIAIVYLLNCISGFISLKKYLSIVLITVSIIVYCYAFNDIYKNYREVDNQIKIIETSNPNKEIIVPLLTPSHSLYNPYNGTAYLDDNPKSWFNLWMAKYYKVSSIKGVNSK
ncbi:hypothetical protein JCM5805K_0543 [Lactococcus lactis subsp. lactis]|uniref:Glycosyltransferase RgtA/B/C/D-like domain-containing protein n=2 Tax=Lactococcus lactis TaxID=1358 RepID=A0A0B8QIB5_LACLL|nr:DUF6056 family protein [Lactococcus lactis]KST76393.1 putative inner membrane protein [Lactococcus lactis subsp. lactis]PCS15912.1 hypothetical protein RU91_GL000749 [Lactococcus lactis subsp. lactis]TDG84375.1 hypothetical protein C5L15_002001 [Lactococcus lactis subsp. lactis]SCW55209.1 hypothetical protein SAMN02982984_01815 [Lactococcus lactis]GAM79435.1 hypothetical protein JCM5805K_0543 [Lactococcus lactis subsp. lactis]